MNIKTERKTRELTKNTVDTRYLWGGIIFSALFTFMIWWTGQRLVNIPHLPDMGALWYYWKLPNPAFWSRLTSWGFYAFHQISIWYLIYYAQKHVKEYINGIHKVNRVALGVNAFFIILHLFQTQIWYDGLAQDVSILSSQGSVILMLVWILLMENKRRGLFFGKKLPIKDTIIHWARKYHGFIFAWATVYTFWYHPTEPTSGHLIGFFYMFLLLLQGSLFFTKIHTNRFWMVLLEVLVLIHGSLVAVMQGNGIWPMFAFGFGGIFIITQMHGLNLKNWMKWAFLVTYIILVLVVYKQRGWIYLNEIIRIPIIEYLLVIMMAIIIGCGLWLVNQFSIRNRAT